MALTLINDNLVLPEELEKWVIPSRELQGYHVYYKGDGVKENPFTFYLSSNFAAGEPLVIVVLTLPDNNRKFDCVLRHATDPQWIRYESTLDSSNKVTAQASFKVGNEKPTSLGTYGVVVTPGTHVFRIAVDKGKIQFYLDDKPFLKNSTRRFGSLRRLEITADALTVYEAHFTDAKERRAFVFAGNGLEAPTTPALYPSSYISFRGTPLEKKQSWVQLRSILSELDPTEKFVFREAAGPAQKEIQVVIKMYDGNFSIWTDEDFQAVYSTQFKPPRSFAIYEFVLSTFLMCVPSS